MDVERSGDRAMRASRAGGMTYPAGAFRVQRDRSMHSAARSSVEFQVNGRRCEVAGADVFLTVSEFVRERLRWTGTKTACEEGDCGSCTVLVGRPSDGGTCYRAVNSCVRFVFQLDGCHLVTIEGLASGGQLTPIQQAMVDCHGSQCGFCTPGFVMAMTGACHSRERDRESPQPMNWPRELSGNLCRCTGYLPILEAARRSEAQASSASTLPALTEAFQTRCRTLAMSSFDVSGVHRGDLRRVLSPVSLHEALRLRTELPEARVIAGATDLGVRWTKMREAAATWIDLGRIDELTGVTVVAAEEPAEKRLEDRTVEGQSGRLIEVGAMATWAEVLRVAEVELPEFACLLSRFGGPQIRHVGTVGGNLVNASSIADSLPLLCVMDAELELASMAGCRRVSINQFFTDTRRTVLRNDELLVRVFLPLPSPLERLRLYKVSRRRDLDIATITAAVRMETDRNRVMRAAIAVGGAGPKVLRLTGVEAWLAGRPFSEETFIEAGALAAREVTPRSDARGSAEYRRQLVQGLLVRYFLETSDANADAE
jgi:xanthine dehydrogenase small subunit